MKKVILILLMGMISYVGFGQRNNIDPKIQASRDIKAIENKMVKENTDAEGVKLIKEHRNAKRKMDMTMRKLPGYGKAATNKDKLEKFREKNEKKDPKFAQLSQDERKKRKEKENYLSNADEEYKGLKQTRDN